MAQGEVIRQLYNEIGLTVDEASAAKAEAVMKGWADSAERLGNVVATAAGKLADFINTSSEFSTAVNRIGRAMAKSGDYMQDFSVNTSHAAKSMELATFKAANLADEVSGIGRETWAAAKKTSGLGTGLQDLAKGVIDTKKAQAALAKAERAEAEATRTTRASTEVRRESNEVSAEGIGTWGKLGLAIQGVREIMGLASGAAHFLVGGLVETSKETLNAAKVAGVSARFFQEMTYAAKTLGIEADDVRDVMLDLSDKAANGGKDQQAAFKELGVKVKDANGKLRPMEDLIGDLADGFAKMKDGTEKTATASTLLGEQGARLLPIFSKGRKGLKDYAAEAHRAGAVMDDEALQAAKDFDRQMVQLESSAAGLRNTLGSALIPALDTLAKSLDKALRRIMPLVKAKAKDWANAFAKAAEWATTGVDKLRAAVTLAAGALLGKYLMSLATVTAAQLTWGSAALIAGAKAAAGAVLAVAPWLLVGAVIALAADELYGFATGSDSALGDFIKWLEKVDPEDNNLIRMLKNAGSLVFDVTDPAKWKRWHNSMQELKFTAVIRFLEYIKEGYETLKKYPRFFKNFFAGAEAQSNETRAGGGFTEEQRRALNYQADQAVLRKKYNPTRPAFGLATQTPEDAIIERARMFGSRDWVAQRGLSLPASAGTQAPPSLMSVPRGPDAMGAYFGRGASASTALPAMSRAGQGGVFAPNTSIQMTVQALPGQSAEDVGAGAMDTALSRADEERRAAHAFFSEG